MPFPVVVSGAGFGVRHDIRANGLIEDDGKRSASRHPQLPRTTAAPLDPTVVRRWIRRPPEPGGDREVRGRDGDRGSRDAVSASGEVSRPANFPRYVRRAGKRPVIYVSREILHQSSGGETLHVVG